MQRRRLSLPHASPAARKPSYTRVLAYKHIWLRIIQQNVNR